ncbi:unnamed protein product, partial [Polarella glacialis]
KTIAEAGAIPVFVLLLKKGSPTAQEKAAGALWNLAVSSDNQRAIAEALAIPPLVGLLGKGSPAATLALRNLALNAENQKALVASGGWPEAQALLDCLAGAQLGEYVMVDGVNG